MILFLFIITCVCKTGKIYIHFVFNTIIIRVTKILYIYIYLICFFRLKNAKRSYDPIDYECIDDADFWVVEEESEGELNIGDIENMLDETEPATQTQGCILIYVD